MYQNAVIEREVQSLKKSKKGNTASSRKDRDMVSKVPKKLKVIREEDISSVSEDSVMVTQKRKKAKRHGSTRRKS